MNTRNPVDYRHDATTFKGGRTFSQAHENRIQGHAKRIGQKDAMDSITYLVDSKDYRERLSGTGKGYLLAAAKLIRKEPLKSLSKIRSLIRGVDFPKITHASQVRLGKVEEQLALFEKEKS